MTRWQGFKFFFALRILSRFFPIITVYAPEDKKVVGMVLTHDEGYAEHCMTYEYPTEE